MVGKIQNKKIFRSYIYYTLFLHQTPFFFSLYIATTTKILLLISCKNRNDKYISLCGVCCLCVGGLRRRCISIQQLPHSAYSVCDENPFKVDFCIQTLYYRKIINFDGSKKSVIWCSEQILKICINST